MKLPVRYAVLCGALLFVCGCTTVTTRKLYDGAERPRGAIAQLDVPGVLEVMSLDGKEVDLARGFSVNQVLRLQLKPGMRAVMARYAVEYGVDDGVDDPETLQSVPVLLEFEAKAGHAYSLRYLEPPPAGARGKDVTCRIWVEEVFGSVPPSESEVPPPGALGPGGQLFNAESPVSQEIPGSVASGSSDSPALEGLKAWWIKAGEKERGAFLQWVVSEP